MAKRVAFDPYEVLGAGTMGFWIFLIVRMVGLVVLTPLAEELFLRGFFLRFLTDEKWWELPIGKLSGFAIAMAAVYGIATHPGEAIAAAVWFTLVTWLSIRTKSFGACVAAHAITNALLGVYILVAQDWTLW